jgi:hypothetical protein
MPVAWHLKRFTIDGAEALRFLESLAGAKHVSQITVADLDKHITSRAPQLKRVTRQHVVTDLRSFLRYLHAQGLWFS